MKIDTYLENNVKSHSCNKKNVRTIFLKLLHFEVLQGLQDSTTLKLKLFLMFLLMDLFFVLFLEDAEDILFSSFGSMFCILCQRSWSYLC